MLTIVIPARNEAENIGEVIRNIKKYVKQKYELFVINDASTDDTAKIAKKLGAKIIHHDIPQGGIVGNDFKKFNGEYIISLDADMEHHPKDIPNIAKALKSCDVVVAARVWRSRVIENVLETVYSFPVEDIWSGFVGVRREWAPFIVKHELRLWLESYLAIDAAGGKLCSVPATTSKGLRPSRFGGAIKGTIKTLVFLRRYRKHANQIRNGTCHLKNE
jgi:hypothetical protein